MSERENSANLGDLINALIGNSQHDLRAARDHLKYVVEYFKVHEPDFYERIKLRIPEFQKDLNRRYQRTVSDINKFRDYLLDNVK